MTSKMHESESDEKTRHWIEHVYRRAPETVYNARYFQRHFEQYRGWERAVGKEFAIRYDVESVIDLGCGVGSYLEGFRDAGVSQLRGYEYVYCAARPFIPEVLATVIRQGDVTLPLDEYSYDCTWSVEVAEHLPPQSSEAFVDNMCRLAKRLLFITAAPPGQGGTGHINCRPKDYWIDLIEKNGFEYWEKELPALWSLCKQSGTPAYIRRNLMLFRRNAGKIANIAPSV